MSMWKSTEVLMKHYPYYFETCTSITSLKQIPLLYCGESLDVEYFKFVHIHMHSTRTKFCILYFVLYCTQCTYCCKSKFWIPRALEANLRRKAVPAPTIAPTATPPRAIVKNESTPSTYCAHTRGLTLHIVLYFTISRIWSRFCISIRCSVHVEYVWITAQ